MADDDADEGEPVSLFVGVFTNVGGVVVVVGGRDANGVVVMIVVVGTWLVVIAVGFSVGGTLVVGARVGASMGARVGAWIGAFVVSGSGRKSGNRSQVSGGVT